MITPAPVYRVEGAKGARLEKVSRRDAEKAARDLVVRGAASAKVVRGGKVLAAWRRTQDGKVERTR
ncbi:MAG: hypothetical protein QM704_06625 [Anaeromyxobacteraceae bacterium]